MLPIYKKTFISASLSLAFGFGVALNVMAGESGSTSSVENGVDALRQTLATKYPASDFEDVRETPMEGIYEIVAGKNIFYTDNNASYLLFGSMYDMEAGRDLTAERKEEVNRISLNLDKKYAIKEVKGSGERVLNIFTDVQCPFCARLESTLEGLDNVTIYRYLYPIQSLHPTAVGIAKKVWCSSDDDEGRNTAFLEYMKAKQIPSNDGSCKTPIDKIIAYAQENKIIGTPTMISDDGRTLPGAVELERIESWLNE